MMLKRTLIQAITVISMASPTIAHDSGACICLREVYWPTLFGTAYYLGEHHEDADNCDESVSTEEIWYGTTPQQLDHECELHNTNCDCKSLGYGKNIKQFAPEPEPPCFPKFSLEGAKKYLEATRPEGVEPIDDPKIIFRFKHPGEDNRIVVVALFDWLHGDYIALEIIEDDCDWCVRPDEVYIRTQERPLPGVYKIQFNHGTETYHAYVFCSRHPCGGAHPISGASLPAAVKTDAHTHKEPTPAPDGLQRE